MTNKRKINLLVLCIFTTILFSSCGNAESDSGEKENAKRDETFDILDNIGENNSEETGLSGTTISESSESDTTTMEIETTMDDETTENITTENVTSTEMTTENITTEKSTTEKVTTEKVTTEKVTTEKATTTKVTESTTTSKVEETTTKEEETTKDDVTASIIKGDITSVSLNVGDVMYDITVETTDGTQYTISELLKEKDMVMLNFWFANCAYCIQEFPYIDEAYALYKDDIEILALNPFDNAANINYIKDTYGITFPLIYGDGGAVNAFGVTGYPTTVVIDRYGVICMVEAGGRPYTEDWINLFEHFTGDDYEQKILYNGMSDLY